MGVPISYIVWHNIMLSSNLGFQRRIEKIKYQRWLPRLAVMRGVMQTRPHVYFNLRSGPPNSCRINITHPWFMLNITCSHRCQTDILKREISWVRDLLFFLPSHILYRKGNQYSAGTRIRHLKALQKSPWNFIYLDELSVMTSYIPGLVHDPLA